MTTSAGSSFLSRYSSATVDSFIREHGDDVARDGVFVETEAPLRVGTPLHFELRLATDETVMAGQARVRWKREPKLATKTHPAGMGLSFLDLDDASRALIARIAAEHPKAGIRFNAAPQDEAPPSERALVAADAVPNLSSDGEDGEIEETHVGADHVGADPKLPSLDDDPVDDGDRREHTLIMPSTGRIQAVVPFGPPSSQQFIGDRTSSALIAVGAPDSQRELPATAAGGPKGHVVITTLLAVIAGALLLIAVVLVMGGAYFARSIAHSTNATSASALASAPPPRPTESVATATSSAPEPSPKPSAVASSASSSAPPASARSASPNVAASAPRHPPAPIRRPAPAPAPRTPTVPAWATD